MNFMSLIALFFCVSAFSEDLIYDGTLYDSDGKAVASAGIKLKAEILNASGSCVMYEREVTVDTSGSFGYFSINLKNGTAPAGQPHTGNALKDVLSNAAGNNVTCSDSNNQNYTGEVEKRLIRITVLEVASVDIDDIQLPTQSLNPLPFAAESVATLKIGGVKVAPTTPNNGQVLRYNSGNSRYEPSDIQATSIAWSAITGIPADIGDGDADTTYSTATTGANGLMSAADKTKLDAIGVSGGIQTSFRSTGIDDNADALAMTINSSENVGIGTPSPSGRLDVEGGDVFIGTGTLTNATGNEDLSVTGNLEVDGILYGNGSGLSNVIHSGSDFANDNISGDKVDGGTISNFRSTGVDDNADALAMTINSSENVGIGTPSPSGRLDVEGGDVFIGTGTLTNATGNEDLSVTGNLEVDGILYGNGSGLTNVIHSGSDFANDSISGDKVNGGTISIFRSTGIDDNADALAMTIDASENIGVGIVNPGGHKLNVNGTFYAANNITSGTGIYAPQFLYTSDRRLKSQIAEIDGLGAVLKLHGVRFDWKKDGSSDIGLIAQEVEQVYPELVQINPLTGYKSVKYGNLVAPLIEAVKTVNEKLSVEQERNAKMQSELEQMKAELAELKALIQK